jgi:hypothetical protein
MKAESEFLVLLPSLSLVLFSIVHLWPAFGTIFRITGGLRNSFKSHTELSESPELTSCRGLLEGFSQLKSDLTEASRNFIFDFLLKKCCKKL